MKTREVHEKLMQVLREISSLDIPEDSRMYVQGHLIHAIREIHKCVIEKIKDDEIENQR